MRVKTEYTIVYKSKKYKGDYVIKESGEMDLISNIKKYNNSISTICKHIYKFNIWGEMVEMSKPKYIYETDNEVSYEPNNEKPLIPKLKRLVDKLQQNKKVRHKNSTKEIQEKYTPTIIELYQRGLSLKAISKKINYKISQATIHKILKNNKLILRTQGGKER